MPPPIPVPGDAPAGVAPQNMASLEAMFRQIWDHLTESQRKTLFSAVISSGGLTVQGGGFRIVTTDPAGSLRTATLVDGKLTQWVSFGGKIEGSPALVIPANRRF